MDWRIERFSLAFEEKISLGKTSPFRKGPRLTWCFRGTSEGKYWCFSVPHELLIHFLIGLQLDDGNLRNICFPLDFLKTYRYFKFYTFKGS